MKILQLKYCFNSINLFIHPLILIILKQWFFYLNYLQNFFIKFIFTYRISLFPLDIIINIFLSSQIFFMLSPNYFTLECFTIKSYFLSNDWGVWIFALKADGFLPKIDWIDSILKYSYCFWFHQLYQFQLALQYYPCENHSQYNFNHLEFLQLQIFFAHDWFIYDWGDLKFGYNTCKLKFFYYINFY